MLCRQQEMATDRKPLGSLGLVRFCLLVLALSGYGSSAQRGRRRLTVRKCGLINTPFARIVGGREARPGDHPWIVSVHEKRDGFEHVCGGAILNEHWIITAAHCIDDPDKPYEYAIYTAVHKLSKKSQKKVGRYKVSKVIVHEDYEPDTFYNDIALLKTRHPIDIKGSRGFVNGICLPATDEDPEGWATVAGWGHTAEDGDMSDVLRAVKLPIVPREECNEAYDDDLEDYYDDVFDGMICAGQKGKDSCQFDSGGPLVQKNQKSVHTLIGVVSFGSGCGDSGMPGVYTKVAAYMDWLEENVH